MEPHTRTCIIIQETTNRFLCPLIVFLKSKAHQFLKDVIELNGDKIPDKIVAGYYQCKTIQSLLNGTGSKTFHLFGLCGCSFA